MTALPAARRGVALAAAVVLAVLPPANATADENPLTNVDVVRMATGGTPEKEIIRAILEAPATAFDLDPEILEEMRIVGVSEAVFDAMKKAQKKRPPPAAPAEPAPTAAQLVLQFEGDPNADAMTRTAVFFEADPNGQRLALEFFVICVEPTHVPDFWHSKSPLKEGFSRHAVLWYHTAMRPYETQRGLKDARLAALDLPEEVTVVVDDAAVSGIGAHRLSVGLLARRAEGEPLLLAHVQTPLKTSPGATSRLTLALSTRDAGVVKRPQRDVPPHVIRIVAVEPDPNAPASAEPKEDLHSP